MDFYLNQGLPVSTVRRNERFEDQVDQDQLERNEEVFPAEGLVRRVGHVQVLAAVLADDGSLFPAEPLFPRGHEISWEGP
jgi:hypothetical protein